MGDKITLIFGDSIVYGVGDLKFGGWVNRLKVNLKDQYVFNLGIPGQTSNEILSRFEIEIKNRFSKDDQFILIFAVGIKDALLLNENKNYIEQFNINLKNIIKISKKYSNDIYFLGLLNVDINKRTNYNYKNINIIEDSIEKIAKKEKVNYIKTRELLSNEDLIDGLHPNINGHKKINDYIIKQIYRLGE